MFLPQMETSLVSRFIAWNMSLRIICNSTARTGKKDSDHPVEEKEGD
jgi:hypothetical protein